jgi:DNA-binding GntR family transcriptional regulator
MKAHEVVMAWVTDELASGRLHVGDHLPSERTLAETLGISRSSVRETMRVLEALGTIHTSTGSGPRSGTILTAAPEQALTLALNLQLATRQVDHHHIFEMRLLLETWAAEHSDPALGDWESAERLLDLMDDDALAVEDFLALRRQPPHQHAHGCAATVDRRSHARARPRDSRVGDDLAATAGRAPGDRHRAARG